MPETYRAKKKVPSWQVGGTLWWVPQPGSVLKPQFEPRPTDLSGVTHQLWVMEPYFRSLIGSSS